MRGRELGHYGNRGWGGQQSGGGREATWPLQAALDTLGLMEGPRQATVGDLLVLNNNGLIVDWCRWGWPQRQGLALAQGNGLVGPAGSTLGL